MILQAELRPILKMHLRYTGGTKMDYNEILALAKGQVGPYCKACPVCNGRACGNTIPGPGSKIPGNTAARNYDKWQDIFVNMDTLCPNANVDTSFELFGKKFSAPVFIAH